MSRSSPRLEWGPQFRTHIKIIDEQHQVLFDLINDIEDRLAEDPVDACQLRKSIDGTVAYSLYHFVTEESLAYRTKATSGMDAHVRTHNAFRKKVKDYRHEAQKGDAEAIATDLLRYLRHWLISHILHTDVALGAEIAALENHRGTARKVSDCDGLRVAVVEDNNDLREEIVFFLSHVGHRAIGCPSGAALNRHMADHGSDIIVLDLGLPDIDGVDLLNRYGGRPDVAIVVLTARGATVDRIAGYQHGADAYLVKPVDMRELVAVVDRAAQRLYPHPSDLGPSWKYSPSAWTLTSPGALTIKLTEQQSRILQLFVHAGRRVLPRKEIIEGLGWDSAPGHDSHNDEKIEASLSRLRRKLEDVGINPTPIKTIRAVGYAFRASLIEAD